MEFPSLPRSYSIDCKHVVIQAPHNSGSMFYNYKGTHSIVLLALCDAHYRFLVVDIGNTGRHSNGGVLANSLFGKALEASTLSIPPKKPLPGGASCPVPYVLVGDEAFPLKPNLMRPYPGRNLHVPKSKAIYNY